MAAFVDETVFHQLLHWHHFYDGRRLEAGLVSTGCSTPSAGSRSSAACSCSRISTGAARRSRRAGPGALPAAGAFQVYDGPFQQSCSVCTRSATSTTWLPYDLAWNISGAVGVVVGIVLLLGPARPIAVRAGDGA